MINFRENFQWDHSPESVHKIACICNDKAEKEGFAYFGLSFYGLCNGFHKISNQVVSGKCVNGELEKCDVKVDDECDGGPWAEALYKTGKKSEEKYVAHPKNKPFNLVVPAAKDLVCDKDYRFRKLACQKEDFGRYVLFNARDTIDWGNFNGWLKKMVCKCRAYAKANKFEYFSVSFWGICGGLDKHGNKHTTTADHCKRTVKGSVTEKTCNLDEEDVPCAGIGYSDVVYDTDTHPCDYKNKAGCAQICNRDEDSYYCSCNNGFKLNGDRHGCDKA